MNEIRFVLDGPAGPDAGRFVEVENENGESINIGEWRQDGNYWYLAVPYCFDHFAALAEKEGLIAALTTENEQIKKRLIAAEDVVSHLVVWGAAPTDALADLVKRSMTIRMRDKQTLCVPSAVEQALRGEEVT